MTLDKNLLKHVSEGRFPASHPETSGSPNNCDLSVCTGGQFTFEQALTKRLTLAAQCYAGNHAVLYESPGAIFKVTSRLTPLAAYPIGNANATNGNHQFLGELGYNFNRPF
jgi:hypothetical protein